MRPACTEIIICTGLKTRGGVGRGGPGHVLRPPAAGLTGAFCRTSGRHACPGTRSGAAGRASAIQIPTSTGRAPMAYRDPAEGRRKDRERFAHRNDLAVRPGDVPLDHVAVVLETAADEMGEEGLRVAARGQGACVVPCSFERWTGTAGTARRPAHGQPRPLRGLGTLHRRRQAMARQMEWTPPTPDVGRREG